MVKNSMVNFQQLKNRQEKLCIVGLGYVGLPLAVLLSTKFDVIGFDVNTKRIDELKNSLDKSGEVSADTLKKTNVEYTTDSNRIRESKFIIIAVPTPVDNEKKPDMSLVEKATMVVGQNLVSGSIVVYESTVYPGATEEFCLPILEKESKLKNKIDFCVGYSPERINPGDKEHSINNVTKVVSAQDQESLEIISQVYGTITKIFQASSIRVAEAAKVVENTQRNINIALMNELAVLFKNMNINFYDVLEAAGTKWNFLPFKPGLVGGHCIGVDPYYLTYKSQQMGYDPAVILAGRDVNDFMHCFIAKQAVKEITKLKKDIKTAKVLILGATFKEDVADVRNSKVFEVYNELVKLGVTPTVYDPMADKNDINNEYGVWLSDRIDNEKWDCIIVAVAHRQFRNMSINDIKKLLNDGAVLMDIKNIYNKKEFGINGINYWGF